MSGIETLDINSAKRDIEPFISDRQVLDIWSKEFFLGVADGLRFAYSYREKYDFKKDF